MVCDGTRRVVIIKNIASNVVDEAILILKDKKSNKNKNMIISVANSSKKTNNYLLREAEDIINSYIKEKDPKGGLVHELNLKPFPPEKRIFTNTVINLALVLSIAVLLFVVVKLF